MTAKDGLLEAGRRITSKSPTGNAEKHAERLVESVVSQLEEALDAGTPDEERNAEAYPDCVVQLAQATADILGRFSPAIINNPKNASFIYNRLIDAANRLAQTGANWE